MKRDFMKNLTIIFLVMLAMSCGNKRKSDEQAFLDSLESMTLDRPMISEEVISDIIQQIPSPLEISTLLKQAGTSYEYDMLNAPENKSNYNSSFNKALNLGIYGTDLGYANIYEQNQDALRFMNAVKGLADDLSIGQFFDFNTLRRLASNSQNLDSLLLITTQNFNNINAYLQENNRSNLSILILTGGWLEALHITCHVAQRDQQNQQLVERIGEQKIILDNVKLLMSFYDQDPYMSDLHKSLLELEEAFAEIEISYQYAEPTFEEVNGMLVVQDNSTTTINITEENVKMIRKKVTDIRKKIIS
jgi:hypothetical protein